MSRHAEIGMKLSGLAGRLEALATILDINKKVYGDECQTGNSEIAIAREAAATIHAFGIELAIEDFAVKG